jgi:hypothetical protein
MSESQSQSAGPTLVPHNPANPDPGKSAVQDAKFIEKVAQRVLELMQQDARIERERRGGGR